MYREVFAIFREDKRTSPISEIIYQSLSASVRRTDVVEAVKRALVLARVLKLGVLKNRSVENASHIAAFKSHEI